MVKNSYIIIVFIFFGILTQGCAGWNDEDKLLFASFAGLNIVDAAQSWDIWTDTDMEELNPCITDRESLVAVKALEIGIVYFVADWFEDQRTQILQVGCGLMAGVVTWNFTQ